MKVIFLGTNGWYNTETGNTPCILIDSKDQYVILDAGNGIYKLEKYISEKKPIYLFLSHFHLDHVFGLHILAKFHFEQPFFVVVKKERRKNLETLVNTPFTKPFKDLSLKVSILELPLNKKEVSLDFDFFPMFHKDECTGYRFNLDGKIIAYSGDSGINKNSIPLSKNADLLIHECSNPSGKTSPTWGHTNPEEVSILAKNAGVKKLILTHFDPDFYPTLENRNQAEKAAKKIFPNTIAAIDDLELTI